MIFYSFFKTLEGKGCGCSRIEEWCGVERYVVVCERRIKKKRVVAPILFQKRSLNRYITISGSVS